MLLIDGYLIGNTISGHTEPRSDSNKWVSRTPQNSGIKDSPKCDVQDTAW